MDLFSTARIQLLDRQAREKGKGPGNEVVPAALIISKRHPYTSHVIKVCRCILHVRVYLLSPS